MSDQESTYYGNPMTKHIIELARERDDWHKVADDRSAELNRVMLERDGALDRIAELEKDKALLLAACEAVASARVLSSDGSTHVEIYGAIEKATAARDAMERKESTT